MGLLSDDQIRLFASSGYLVVSGLVGRDDLDRADAEVKRLVSDAPPPEGHVGHHFYWRSPQESPSLFGPDGLPGRILDAAGELIAPGQVRVAFNQAQVALSIPPYRHRPGRPHIDGYRPGQTVPGTFTLLAGLLLNDQQAENSGNLWVWPGTPRSHAAFFAGHGPEAFAVAGGYPDVDLPVPTQVVGRRGDVLLAHYLLGHNIGGNYSSDRTRRALYWRLRAEGHRDQWADCLTNEWHEYVGVRQVLLQS
jgi:hypothetical protein